MALRLASPGISIREVDLTRGGVDFTVNVVAGLAAPFRKGPVNEITRINNEKELIEVFGQPGVGTTDYHYETFLAASNFLSYGGKLDIVRCKGGDLNNANAAVGYAASTSLMVENIEDYENNNADDLGWYFAAKNPGSWANEIKVAVIDNISDQILTPTLQTGSISSNVTVGMGVTQALTGQTIGVGTVTNATGILKGIVTAKDATAGTVEVRVVSTVIAGTETLVNYQQNSQREFKTGSAINFVNSSGSTVAMGQTTTTVDWYNTQNILTSIEDGGNDLVTLPWRSVLNRPQTSNYTSAREGSNDALHIVVIDAAGNVTGDPASVLEKFPNLSKSKDAKVTGNLEIYYKDYLAENSEFLWAGASLVSGTDSYNDTEPVASGFSSGFTAVLANSGAWGQDSEKVKFNSVGNQVYKLEAGLDYTGIGVFGAPLGDVIASYNKFRDPEDADIRFLLQGSAYRNKEEEQAKANHLISLCEFRKDCITFISPCRTSLVNVTDNADKLKNVLEFFSPITSSSYAIFDAGYQYVYDRFNRKFVYMPTSSDIAGLCARTDRDNFPWFSPAGETRGNLNFPVKLAFNPGQDARDQLYSNRINPIISRPGSGIILFGDKTGLSFESAFDRINVRRLFITLEKAIENAARAQLFELNDAGTRTNFVNIVEPFLRDVQSKRGVTDFLVVCDETNNTPDVIDRNEFLADIFIKPARSINFIGLTFVATRTGVSFSEVVGTV